MKKITKSQIITIFGILVLILALPLAVLLTKKKQDIRPRAALLGKANFLLSADSTKSSVGKNIIVYATLQLTDDNLRVSGVDFTLIYDKEKLEVGQIVPALKIYNPQAVFTDALLVSSGGYFDEQYDFLRVAEIVKKDSQSLPKGTNTLAKIIFRGKGEGQATIKFPEGDQYAQVVGTGTYVPPTAVPPGEITPTCIKAPDACIALYPPPPECVEPPGGWCPPENNPTPTCSPPPFCLNADPPCQIPVPAGGWCPNVGVNQVQN